MQLLRALEPVSKVNFEESLTFSDADPRRFEISAEASCSDDSVRALEQDDARNYQGLAHPSAKVAAGDEAPVKIVPENFPSVREQLKKIWMEMINAKMLRGAAFVRGVDKVVAKETYALRQP